jgi:endoglucanase
MRAPALFLFLLLLLPMMHCTAPATAAASADWQLFGQRFIEASGRVVDDGEGRVSHSEGQGFTMLLATHFHDRAIFQRVWQWTRQNLQTRDDALFAWRWESPQGVTDRNDASDADLLIAWALQRAGEQWHDADYLAASRKIAQDIRSKLLRRGTHGLVLLPGLQGFDKPDGLVVNLSYLVLPALPAIARADPAPEWEELAQNGLKMLQYAHFGRWGLPPDWLKLSDPVAPADGFPARFGYDALRIPLYLLWSKRETAALMAPYHDFWSYFAGGRFLPAWTNLGDDSVDSHDAGSGIHAIAAWAASYPDKHGPELPALDRQQPYYSSVLLLLCKAALAEREAP